MKQWMIYGILAALFASLVAVFSKMGLKKVDPTVATTIRSLVMFVFLVIVIIFQKKVSALEQFKSQDYLYIVLAGIAGAISWIFYFLALKSGEATKVAALDRLSIVFVMFFAIVFLAEKFSVKVLIGVITIVIGSVLVVL